ncbi:MAG: gluconate 2-dehydrogenase subunit 3 family protein [Pseudomonadota bacterium]
MSQSYSPKMDRRTTLKWLLVSVGATPVIAACGQSEPVPAETTEPLLGTPAPLTGTPYGADPDMLDPQVTWERTMTRQQLQLVAALCDVVMPASDALPAASTLGVPDFVDEWVSSPYEMTQGSRTECFGLFEWLEGEARDLGAVSFAAATTDQQKSLLDRFAWNENVEAGLENQASAFASFRTISVSAYLSSAEGSEWLGYQGNRPATGDYAGPTQEALDHLAAALEPLGLSIPEGL